MVDHGRRRIRCGPFIGVPDRAATERTMALSPPDRRRILLACAITTVALPALWYANQPDSGAPNVATAGIAVGDGSASDAEPGPEADTGRTTATDDETGAAPVFLDGPTAQLGAGVPEIAVPIAPSAERVTIDATFRSNVVVAGVCRVPGLGNGQQITVVNLDNNRSITCTTKLTPADAGHELVMHPELFSQIADLTDAPIPVEIRR